MRTPVNSITAEELKSRINLEDYISRYTQLNRSGRDFIGLCPFHSEKTPSFRVHNGRWRCFGACNTGGDIYDFLMQIEHIDFMEAYQRIAKELGMNIEDEHQELHEIMRFAAERYHRALIDKTSGAIGRNYLENRGVNIESIQKWELGVCEKGMEQTLLNRFSPESLKKCGVIAEGSYGLYDPMVNRLVIPIRSNGRIVGFGGRYLGDSDMKAKYVNTTDTVLFHKHQVVFGLAQARRYIDATDTAILTEGYFDVIGAHQQGISNTVAVMSAHPSIEQIRRIRANRFILAFDGDKAGRESTERTVEMLLSQGKTVSVVKLPDGKDVDEVDFRQYLDAAQSQEDYLLELAQDHPHRALQILNEAQDNTLKANLTAQIAGRIGVPPEGLDIKPSRNLHYRLPQRNSDLESAVAGELQKRPERIQEIVAFFDGVRPFDTNDFLNADCREVIRVVLKGEQQFHLEIDDDCQNIVQAARSLRMRRLANECARGENDAIREKTVLLARHFP